MDDLLCRQEDLAKALGISQMTVSLALRGSRRVSIATRKRVEKAATKMGYRRNSLFAALRAQRDARHDARYRGTLAWLTNFPNRDGWKMPWIGEYHAGAIEASRRWGYQLDTHWYREEGIGPERLGKILYARGVSGILLPPQPGAHTRMDLDWAQFSAVRFGYSLEWPPVNLVTNHHFFTISQILDELVARGFRRIGYALPCAWDERFLRQTRGAYLAWQQTAPRQDRIPVHVPDVWSPQGFLDWVRKCRPDAVVTAEPETLEVLKRGGIRVPGDISVAFPAMTSTDGRLAGIDQNHHAIGYAAATMLVSMIERGERGIPATTRHLLLCGHWVDGKSVANGPGGKAAKNPRKKAR